MNLNPDDYCHHLDAFDMPEAQKHELIQLLARIMASFVERAFGDAPEQTLLGIVGDQSAPAVAHHVESDGSPATTFNRAATEDAARKRTR